MLLPELPRGDLIPFFERTDQVAAVCKAGLGGNKVQVIIGKEEQVLDLVQTDKFDILLAALSVVILKTAWQSTNSSYCIYAPALRC